MASSAALHNAPALDVLDAVGRCGGGPGAILGIVVLFLDDDLPEEDNDLDEATLGSNFFPDVSSTIPRSLSITLLLFRSP